MLDYSSNAIKRLIAKESVLNGAIGAFEGFGYGDKMICDKLATDQIRTFLLGQNYAKIFTKTGEGEMDEAAMIGIGEILGNGKIELDIAIDPLDCTDSCAKGMDNSISAICIADKGSIISCPDIYMEKLASCNVPHGVISLNASFEENIELVAKFKAKKIEDVAIIMLDRPRHQDFINIARRKKVRIHLVRDGDIMAILRTYFEDIDFYYGLGGSPEGVISASASFGLGGFFEGRFIFEDKKQQNRALEMGIISNKIYSAEELVGKSSIFAICAVGGNAILGGLKIDKHNNITINGEIILIDSELKNCERIKIKKFI